MGDPVDWLAGLTQKLVHAGAIDVASAATALGFGSSITLSAEGYANPMWAAAVFWLGFVLNVVGVLGLGNRVIRSLVRGSVAPVLAKRPDTNDHGR